MTDDVEWKMIRFFGIPPKSVRWEIRWFTKDNVNYHPHTGDMSMVEPAPPNNWRPVCFYNWEDKLGFCQMSELKEFVKEHSINCETCPFRIVKE